MYEAFFALLRGGLWHKPVDPALFTDMGEEGWTLLLRLAQRQTVVAIVFDGINTLPPELRPPRKLYLQWAAVTAQIEQANEALNAEVARLFGEYKEAGLSPILLKGQGNAACYLNPLRRQSGDIDIYLGKKGQRAANELLEKQGFERHAEDTEKHTCYHRGKVMVENHRTMTNLDNLLRVRFFYKLLNGWYPKAADLRRVGEVDIPVPPATFNAFYLFLHIFEHLMNGGVGLRQVCDWTRLLATEEIDHRVLRRSLRKMGLLRIAAAYAHIAVHRLGLPKERLPFSIAQAKTDAKRVLADMMKTGNFGHHDEEMLKRPGHYWAGKWFFFRHVLKRCNYYHVMAPTATMWHVLTLIRGTITIQLFKMK
jgi:hypothetical protein